MPSQNQGKGTIESNVEGTDQKLTTTEKAMKKIFALRHYLLSYCRGKEYISFMENLKRFLLIFTPYFLVLLVASISFSVLMQTLYLSKLQSSIADFITDNFKQYLKFINQSEQMKLSIGFQRIVNQAQVVGQFIRQLDTSIAFEDFMINQAVDSQQSTITDTWNFKKMSSFSIDSICDEYQSQLKQYQLLQPNLDLEYFQQQFFSWFGSNQADWSSLDIASQKFLVSSGTVVQQFSQVFQLNQKYEEIKTAKFFLTRETDGLTISNNTSLRLFQDEAFWNTAKYGAPFSCELDSLGKRQGYKFTDVSQFDGFQYLNSSNLPCSTPKGSSTPVCSCSKNNVKRLFPIEPRCRPWYLASNTASYINLIDPYIDIDTYEILSTVTFKIVSSDAALPISKQVSSEELLNQDYCYGVDIDFSQLQKRYKEQETSNDEYSYIVATRQADPDNPDEDFQYTTLTYPKSMTKKEKIYELEFADSPEKDLEISEYISKTSFMTKKNIRAAGCSNYLSSTTNNIYEYITINEMPYLTLFSTIQVCYGNLYEQRTLTVGFLARAISKRIESSASESINKDLAVMTKSFIAFVAASFMLSSVALYYLLKQLLKHNFDRPISILNRFLKEAESREIYELNCKMIAGELKTQQELQNIISAINSVVISIQMQVQKEMHSNDLLNDMSTIVDKYKEALGVFQAVEHKVGLGLCYNNLAFISIVEGQLSKALYYQRKSQAIDDDLFDEHIKQMDANLSLEEKERSLCQDKQFRIFMQLRACRKYQLALIILQLIEEKVTFQTIIEGSSPKGEDSESLDTSNVGDTCRDETRNRNQIYRLQLKESTMSCFKDQRMQTQSRFQMETANLSNSLQETPSFPKIQTTRQPSMKREGQDEEGKREDQNNKDFLEKRKIVETLILGDLGCSNGSDGLDIFRKKIVKSGEIESTFGEEKTLNKKAFKDNNNEQLQDKMIPEMKFQNKTTLPTCLLKTTDIPKLNSDTNLKENIDDERLLINSSKFNPPKEKTEVILTSCGPVGGSSFLETDPLLMQNQDNETIVFSNEIQVSCCEAIKYLFEALRIMETLNQTNQENIQEKNNDTEQGSFCILIMLALGRGQLLMKNRQILVKEILTQVKARERIFKEEQKRKHAKLKQISSISQVPFDVIKSKYSLMKAQLAKDNGDYALALKQSLKAIGVKRISALIEQQQQQQQQQSPSKKQNSMKNGIKQVNKETVTKQQNFYDPKDIMLALKLILEITKRNRVQLSKDQEQLILKDIEKLDSLSDNQCELSFFEVFFKDENWANDKNSL